MKRRMLLALKALGSPSSGQRLGTGLTAFDGGRRITLDEAYPVDQPSQNSSAVLVMVTFRLCSAVQPISVSEGARFSKPRATPSLYYTCYGPQRACPAGEQGWMAKTGKCENYRPPRARHVGEEDWRSCASWRISFTVRTSRTGSGCASVSVVAFQPRSPAGQAGRGLTRLV